MQNAPFQKYASEPELSPLERIDRAIASVPPGHPLQRELIPTGLFIELPIGFEAQIRPRSGLAIKQGITCLNSPGTVDADYRGEIKVILINLSNETVTIHDGERIAQMVIQKVDQIEWLTVEIINETQRGDGGFGHTGKK